MAGDFDDILPRVGVRGTHHGGEHFIQSPPLAHDVAMAQGMGGRLVQGRGSPAGGLEASRGDGNRIATGEADDGEASFTQRRGDGCDGVAGRHRTGLAQFGPSAAGNEKVVWLSLPSSHQAVMNRPSADTIVSRNALVT